MRRWVLVTREPEKLVELTERLARHRIDVLAFPTLIGRDVPVVEARDRVLAAAPSIRWVALTSGRAAAPLAALLAAPELRRTSTEWPVAALGEATAAAARRAGLRVDLIGTGDGATLAAALAPRVPAGGRVLFACGRDHRDELCDTLERTGIPVTLAVVYAMDFTPPTELPPLPETPPLAVVLSSPRAAEGYARACGTRFRSVPHIAFGATTAAAAAQLGLPAVALDRPTPSCIEEEICQIS